MPDHSDDLFEELGATVSEAQKSWEAFANAITDRSAFDNADQSVKPEPVDECRKVVSRDEHTDWLGFVHTKITTKTYDSEDNEIGSGIDYTVRRTTDNREKQQVHSKDDELDSGMHFAFQYNSTNREKQQAGSESPGEVSGDTIKKNGWFWK